MEITEIKKKDIKEPYACFDVNLNSLNIPKQVSSVIEKILNISNTLSEIPAITDISLCLEPKEVFCERLKQELQMHKIPFKQIYLSKWFVEDNQEVEHYFLIDF